MASTCKEDDNSVRHKLADAPQIIAPYITCWSAERDLSYKLVERPGGIGYADELLCDRDTRGVLWQRAAVRHGVGKPEFGKVHPLRQRRAMRRLLCQVCSGPADRNDDGVLWLLRDYRGDWPEWPDSMGCNEPPVCVPCVPVSLRMCPALRRGAVAIRAREFDVAGVRGALYRAGTAQEASLSYEDPDIRWLVASALVRELRGCTFVPLGELAEVK